MHNRSSQASAVIVRGYHNHIRTLLRILVFVIENLYNLKRGTGTRATGLTSTRGPLIKVALENAPPWTQAQGLPDPQADRDAGEALAHHETGEMELEKRITRSSSLEAQRKATALGFNKVEVGFNAQPSMAS
ncbi:uncharacterized protein DS421_3g78810 [Arachis hypogaea]|nr:uncharacterized protein DS421_3g78810 [Arachis hypogaea]